MAKIRPFRLDDIPGVVALRRKSFRHSERPAAAALGAYFEHVFFRNPWRDETLPSLVYVDPSGRPVGFLGVVPRRATFRGEVLRVAVTTQLMASDVPARWQDVAQRPDYDETALAWLLEQLAAKRALGELRRAALRDAGGALVGWYLYYANRGGLGQVVQVAAAKGRYGDVAH